MLVVHVARVGHPIVADGRLFFGTFSGLVIALDANSGCALWVFEAHAGVRTALTLGTLADGTTSLFFGAVNGSSPGFKEKFPL